MQAEHVSLHAQQVFFSIHSYAVKTDTRIKNSKRKEERKQAYRGDPFMIESQGTSRDVVSRGSFIAWAVDMVINPPRLQASSEIARISKQAQRQIE